MARVSSGWASTASLTALLLLCCCVGGAAGQLTVTRGDCTIEDQCVLSPNFPASFTYASSDGTSFCSVSISSPGYLTARTCNVSEYSDLMIDGKFMMGAEICDMSFEPIDSTIQSFDLIGGNWKLCWTTSVATAAPTISASTLTEVYVSNTGHDDPDCGVSLANACGSIQQALDFASAFGTLHISPGVNTCTGVAHVNGLAHYNFSGVVSKPVTIMGSGAIIDCSGGGAGFSIIEAEHVLIDGLHFQNGRHSCGGGICASEVANLTISSCSFSNCSGDDAGAIWVRAGTNPGNIRTFSNLQISECHGKYNGGIVIGYRYDDDGWSSSNNQHVFSNVTVIYTYAGNGSSYGGAGAISIWLLGDQIVNNSFLFEQVRLIGCRGGDVPRFGGGAGGLAISYTVVHATSGQYDSNVVANDHVFTNLSIVDCHGGNADLDTLAGQAVLGAGGAGALSISYRTLVGNSAASVKHNSHQFTSILIHNCTGGQFWGGKGGSAAGISISYYVDAQVALLEYNKHYFTGLTIHNCTGGNFAKYAAGAAGLSISVKAISQASTTSDLSTIGRVNGNAIEFSNATITSCVGGNHNAIGGAGGLSVAYSAKNCFIQYNNHRVADLRVSKSFGGNCVSSAAFSCQGGGAGGLGISYYIDGTTATAASSIFNSHIFTGLILQNCGGGNLRQKGGGAGGLGLSFYCRPDLLEERTMLILPVNNSGNHVTLSNSSIIGCEGGNDVWAGGGAGSVSISFSSLNGNNLNNSAIFEDVSVLNSSGGNTHRDSGFKAPSSNVLLKCNSFLDQLSHGGGSGQGVTLVLSRL